MTVAPRKPPHVLKTEEQKAENVISLRTLLKGKW